jgi:hypothetical protein
MRAELADLENKVTVVAPAREKECENALADALARLDALQADTSTQVWNAPVQLIKMLLKNWT